MAAYPQGNKQNDKEVQGMNKRKLPQESPLWISVDPANKTGIAFWSGSILAHTGILREVGSSGNYKLHVAKDGRKSSIPYSSKIHAWEDLCNTYYSGLVVEKGAGRFATAVDSQAMLRGYILACCDSFHTQYKQINVSEWRRVIREAYGVSFPANSKGCKELSKKLVKQEFGIDVSDDEADACLIGRAALRMRLLDWM